MLSKRIMQKNVIRFNEHTKNISIKESRYAKIKSFKKSDRQLWK